MEGEPILLAGGKVVTRPDIVAPVSSVVLFSFCGFCKGAAVRDCRSEEQ